LREVHDRPFAFRTCFGTFHEAALAIAKGPLEEVVVSLTTIQVVCQASERFIRTQVIPLRMRLSRLAVSQIAKVILREVLDRTLASWASIRAAHSIAVSQVVRHGQDLEGRHTAVFVVGDALKSGIGAEKSGLLLLFGRGELVVIHV